MKLNRILPALLALAFALPAASQMTFKKVTTKTSFGAAKQGDSGELVVDGKRVRFVKGRKLEYFSVPSDSLTEVFYSRVSGRRIKSAIFLSPFLLFTKGRKHYLTMSFNDGQDAVGAVEFQLHKSNYRGVLRALEEVSGLTMKYDQEGIKDKEQDVAGRTAEAADARAIVSITSSPSSAEVTIDGAFAGNTPREKALAPGEYKIKVAKKGYADWERKILVDAGEELTINAELEVK